MPLVHDLALLLDRFKDLEPPPISEDITDLTQFATIRRYEESITFYIIEELNSVVEETDKLLKWARKLIFKS